MNKALFLIGILSITPLAAATPALADVKDGVDAWSRGDYDAAIRQWRGPAEKGDPDAQFNLAQAYKLGRGVDRDLAKAEDLFGKAAAKGHLQAADNYGLLLFQRGEHARAMPFITTSAGRGDARSQYLLGLAHFNGDQVPKDWVRAYALVSLARQAGLPQADSALSQMDQYVPMEQRQQSVILASKLAAEAEATRARQVAAADLGSSAPSSQPAPARPAPQVASREKSTLPADRNDKRADDHDGPRSAGADFARPKAPVVTATARPAQPSSKAPTPSAPAAGAVAATTQRATGPWRVQLGAFSVAGNADTLWNRVKGRPELSGHDRIVGSSGKLTTLQAGGFASASDAKAACDRLKAGGFQCLVTRK